MGDVGVSSEVDRGKKTSGESGGIKPIEWAQRKSEKGMVGDGQSSSAPKSNNGVVSCSEAVRVALWTGGSETTPQTV
jgi:hypothetical protein